MGNIQKDKGDLEAAIESYKQALKIKPDWAEGYSDLGNALLLINQTEQALVSFEKAISLKKDLNTAISGLGRALLKKGEHSEGLDKLRQSEGSILFNIKSGLSIK
jgi:tetratricopeptide (TPR) repeat protein